jgi:DNA polymerase III alpha subunit (gram-positive type)
MIVLAFDTETTGLIESRLKQQKFQPHVIQFCGILVDLDTGKTIESFDTFIRPPSPELINEHITKVTRISWEMVQNHGSFKDHAKKIRNFIENSPAVAAHNLIFDMDVLNVEFARLDQEEVKWPTRQICTIEASSHINGYRLKLGDLHKELFGEEFIDAHDARVDTEALVRCLVELKNRDWI